MVILCDVLQKVKINDFNSNEGYPLQILKTIKLFVLKILFWTSPLNCRAVLLLVVQHARTREHYAPAFE